MIRAFGFRFSLTEWIRQTKRFYGERVSMDEEKLVRKLVPFFKERLIFELQAKAGTKEYELLQAILASDCDVVADVYERFDQLRKALKDLSFVHACKVMERTANILKGAKGVVSDQVNTNLFQDPLEGRLFDLIEKEAPEIERLIAKYEYATAVKQYGRVFQEVLHEFFEKVMVNADDLSVRANRQGLMKRVYQVLGMKVADLSKISNLS